MSPHGAQVELPFEGSGITEDLRSLLNAFAARRRSRGRTRNNAKPDLTNVNLELPLSYCEGQEVDVPDARFEFEPTKDSTPQARALRVEDIPDGFDVPSIELCAFIAYKLLFHHLHVLVNERGSAKVKEEILDWIFASNFRFAEKNQDYSIKKLDSFKFEDEGFSIPMHKLPFTCQYCCMVEEIDYDDLCAAIHEMVDQQRRPPAVGKTSQEDSNESKHENTHPGATVRGEQQACL